MWPLWASSVQYTILHFIKHLVSVYISIQAKDEHQLKSISEALSQDKMDHKLWIEQPENYPTCLVTKPYTKEHIQKYFKKLKLLK